MSEAQKSIDQGARVKKSIRGPLIVVVAGLLIIAGIAYAYFHSNHKAVEFGTPDNYSLKGGEAGQGISFQKPGKLSLDSSSTVLPYMVAFNFVQTGKSLGYIAAESPLGASNYKTFERPAILKSVNISNPETYKTLPGIGQFIKTNIPSSVSVSYSAPVIFRNPAITSDAWQFDLKLTDKKSSETNEGRLIYMIGKNNYYIFMAIDQGDTWKADQATWTGVLNSIKIDQ